MAVKKSELYSVLWEACNKLRGGVEPAKYKDYVLILLFFKYVSDKYKNRPFSEFEIPDGASFDDLISQKNKSDVGEKTDKILQKFITSNKLQGSLPDVSFNNTDELGSGEELVKKVSDLIAIFQNPALDFKNNRASGDDIIGDAYEYFMMKFAQESGKSKGQFYTPSEVSRVIARLVGMSNVQERMSLYDPACGSGSLLIRAADEAPTNSYGDSLISIYGQDSDNSTAGLAKMNLILHNKGTGEIKKGNSLANPKFIDSNGGLKKFDFIVMNPPFSDKDWSDGIKPEEDKFRRFAGFGIPPQKNGDWAWFLHVVRSLKSNGKAGIVMPHGVLFRGNSEEEIRKHVLERKLIKGIVSLPANLFYGTGIPACLIFIDKENAEEREGIFFIDASDGFKKDGNKNRLREQDIEKIVRTYNQRTEIQGYSRFVTYESILEENDGNLNVPRYIQKIDNSLPQNVRSHLQGTVPLTDIDSLSLLWNTSPSLKDELFDVDKKNSAATLKVETSNVLGIISADENIADERKRETLDNFHKWECSVLADLQSIDENTKPLSLIRGITNDLLDRYKNSILIDKFDVFDIAMNYWNETMQDDVFIISTSGWEVGRDLEIEYKKDKKNIKSFEGVLIPKGIVKNEFFADELNEIEGLDSIASAVEVELQNILEEQNGDESLFAEVLNAKGDAVNKTSLNNRIKELNAKRTSKDVDILQELIDLLEAGRASEMESLLKKSPLEEDYEIKNKGGGFGKAKLKAALRFAQANAKLPDVYTEEYDHLTAYKGKLDEFEEACKEVKEKRTELDALVIGKYDELNVDEIKHLVIDKKWMGTIHAGIAELFDSSLDALSTKVNLIAKRYETPLKQLEERTQASHAKVADALARMGY